MKTLNILLCLLCFSMLSHGQQRFLTKQGYTSFFSSSPMEDIKADNNQVLSIIDTSTGTIAISILMKSFQFEKSLMQEHFNENYVESDKYPKAVFKGQIANFEGLNNNEQEININGNITIHGVTKQIQTTAKIIRTDKNISLKGKFPIEVADFDIEIPSVVVNNIAKTIEVTFELDHKPYNK
ncbi:YceI family protein [Aquimarina sp. MMG016]|uniref:YceI family protein n=1 Tax=Aquimarina sp. MMG016 TaxID=2822690 RepID=UPI001B39D335|nr:YceI family protein [Aquimarina sp. MMG016]MBQ4819411.1 YceI family protein [Aquimarina sp. MMG016]